jgi:hypothetical protein
MYVRIVLPVGKFAMAATDAAFFSGLVWFVCCGLEHGMHDSTVL